MLCEAAWVLIRTPGPLRAFYERVRARRGAQIALVATARKLGVLFWHLLTREEDYAFERPTLTRRKLRGLESQGMVVAASVGDEGKPVLASFIEDIENGARLK